MSTSSKQEAVEALWRQTLSAYRQQGLRERLSKDWPGDRNVSERLAYEYPPTFQPGYVGPRYFGSRMRTVLLGLNPGEGSQPGAVARDRRYLATSTICPFKTSANRAPLTNSPLRRHVWRTYVVNLLELLEPALIAPMGAWCTTSVEAELRDSSEAPEVLRVWHPSDYNFNTRPQKLLESWSVLSTYLRHPG
jgi:hypothetical protein